MPLSRKVLEQLQAEAMADDVLIDYATMAHWTESQAVQYFECGGAVEPAVENPSTALSWVHTREPELAIIERSLVAATASADAKETPTASDSAADAVLQLPELAQRILDFVAEGGINRREVDASRHAEAEQESVANALRSSEATCRLWRSLNPQSRLWGSVPPVVLKVLREMHVKWPSRLQGFALPKILAGHDVLIVGDSGTGKTTCCALAALCAATPEPRPQVLLLHRQLSPGADLASMVRQLLSDSRLAGGPLSISEVCSPTAGDVPLSSQLLCGAPAHIEAVVGCSTLDLSGVRLLAIDGADDLLQTVAEQDVVMRLRARLPAQCQLLVTSATRGRFHSVDRLVASLAAGRGRGVEDICPCGVGSTSWVRYQEERLLAAWTTALST